MGRKERSNSTERKRIGRKRINNLIVTIIIKNDKNINNNNKKPEKISKDH
jgi:hypothetical protein